MVVVAMEARSREQTSTSLKQLIESATELSSSWIHHHPDLHVEPTPPRALHPIISTPRQVYYPAWSFDFLPPRQPHPRSQSHAARRHRRRHHHRRRDPWLPVQLRHALPPHLSLFLPHLLATSSSSSFSRQQRRRRCRRCHCSPIRRCVDSVSVTVTTFKISLC